MVVVSRCARAGRGGVGRRRGSRENPRPHRRGRILQRSNPAWPTWRGPPLKFIPMNSAARRYKNKFPNRNRLSNAQRLPSPFPLPSSDEGRGWL